MMKQHTFFLFLLLLTWGGLHISCSNKNKLTDNYQLKIDSLVTSAKEFAYSDPLSARKLFKEALALETDSLKWYDIFALSAITYLYTNDFDTVRLMVDQINTRFGNKDNLSPEEHYIMGRMYNMKSYYMTYTYPEDSVLMNFEKGAEHLRLGGHLVNLPDLYINIADVYLRSSRYVEAVSYFRKGLAITDSIQTSPDIRPVCNTGLGRTYSELRNFELADYYYDQAYIELDSLILLQDKFNYYNNRGTSYYQRNQYPTALEYFQSAYSLIRNNPEYLYQNSIVQSNLGEAYLLMNRLDSAGYYLPQAAELFHKSNNNTGKYHIETLLFELSIRKNELKKARQIMSTFSSDEKVETMMVYVRKKYLQHYYETVQDYTNAYKYLRENVALEDSISNSLIKMRAEETDMRYQHDAALVEQAHLIERQQNDMEALQLNRYIWIMAAFVLLLIASFIYFYMRRQRLYLAEKHRNRIVALRMENIRNRVSPHFIFNILNHIISRFDRDDKSYQELFNLIKLMRMNLTLTEKLNISLEEELDFVETYVVSRKQESGIEMDFTVDVDDSIDTSSIEIPSMIIQIPVENSIKHGFREEKENKYIKISVSKPGKYTAIQITDNGSGFYLRPGNRDMQSTGTGLKVLTQTIELLNSYNKEQIIFSIENKKEGSGCIIRYTIPDKFNYKSD